MYGLLLENLATFIKAQWGEGKWESVRRHAGIDIVAFSIHHVYPETLMRRIARSAFQVLGVDERQFFKALGVYFVQYVSQYGYDQLLSVLGRHLRDFLNGLDNLHEYLKFSYPKMRAPSFYCDDETESGLKLHYRSKRRGFVYYVMGQIKQVAKQFYNQECNIHLLSEEVVGETIHVVFELAFDNSAFSEAEELRALIGKDLRLPVRASTLFELFPFCIVFNSSMEITHTGHTLMTILKDLVGQVMTEAFDMTRPLIPFCFSAIMQRRNNIFELVTVAPIHDVNQYFGATDSVDVDEGNEIEGTRLRLRGQMLYMEDWNMMLYLANPVMPDLNGLVDASLFINDLSLHDCSRDLVLAGTQQSVELKLALDQEQQKSRKLVQSMKKLDEEMRRTDELLYQMIPKQVADRIRRGENPVETCQNFDSVSILFTDVVNFTDICSKITPLQVVSMLNHMYFLFDQLSERNGVYKVETVGDSYMVVSGAPVSNLNHAERICDMAMDIIDASEAIDDPSGREKSLKVRVGCHSGAVVAGVVGIKMPRYCLFGDAVNTASRMESTAEPGKVQISEACKSLLPSLYQFELRGTVNVKGKGEMYTYWLLGREARVPLSKYYSKTIIWTPSTVKFLNTMSRPISPTSSQKALDRIDSSSVNSIPVLSPTTNGSFKNQNISAAVKAFKTVRQSRPSKQHNFNRRQTNCILDGTKDSGEDSNCPFSTLSQTSSTESHTMNIPSPEMSKSKMSKNYFEHQKSIDIISSRILATPLAMCESLLECNVEESDDDDFHGSCITEKINFMDNQFSVDDNESIDQIQNLTLSGREDFQPSSKIFEERKESSESICTQICNKGYSIQDNKKCPDVQQQQDAQKTCQVAPKQKFEKKSCYDFDKIESLREENVISSPNSENCVQLQKETCSKEVAGSSKSKPICSGDCTGGAVKKRCTRFWQDCLSSPTYVNNWESDSKSTVKNSNLEKVKSHDSQPKK